MTSRSFTGLFVAALLALPAAANAQTHGSSSSERFSLGVLGGAEWGDSSGYQFRLDGEVPIVKAAPNLRVSGLVSVSYSGLEHSISVFEIVPAARLTYQANPQFGGYADLGLGFARASAPNVNSVSGATMRIGVGAFYQMNSQVKFPIELAFHPHWGDYNQTTTTLMIGAKFSFF
jgi:hypothetical protein